MNDTRTVSFTYKELEVIETALNYALTNPYNTPDTERALYSACDKVTEALKRPNIEDVYAHIAEHGETHVCGTCVSYKKGYCSFCDINPYSCTPACEAYAPKTQH